MEEFIQSLSKMFGDRIRKNVILAPCTTFKIGGAADLLFEAETEEEIVKVVQLVRRFNFPYVILGGGSNVLVSDDGFRGLAVIIKNSLLSVQRRGNEFIIKVDAGVALSKLLAKTQELSATGLEFVVGIPGTVGGAIRGNAGAWQENLGDKVTLVTAINAHGKVVIYSQEECSFGYRDSCFKHNNEIILKAELVLPTGNKAEIEALIKENLLKRSTQPKEPSAGCIFVNPENQPAGLLIDKCNLKGFKIGGAQVSDKHANFIINTGRAKARDVADLIDHVKQKVREKFALDLKEEIVRIGKF